MARYLPISQHFNDDPETWELTDEFGDRAIRLVIEIFSILDRNDNQWKLVDRWEFVLGKKLRMSPAKCWRIVGWMLAKHWLIVGQVLANGSPSILQARNYAKYRKTRSGVSPPPVLTSPNQSDSYKNKNPDSPSAGFLKTEKRFRKKEYPEMAKSMGLIPELKEQTDRVYKYDPIKFKRIAAWVAQGRKHRYLETDMAEALRQFWDYRMIDEWYPYLDTILEKVVKDRNMRESETEHQRHLAELKDLGESARNSDPVKSVLSVVRGLSDAKKA